MKICRRILLSLVVTVSVLTGCAALAPAVPPQARADLAPTGVLRVGVYPGSPSSLVRDSKTGETAGVAFDLGQALGRRLGVAVQVVEFSRAAQVVDAARLGQVDFIVSNATPARARDVDFTPAVVQIELGYLVLASSPIKQIADVDRPGMRIGVSQGSTSEGVLGRQFKSASVVPIPSMAAVQEALRQGKVDAFATNKGILFELSDSLPGSRVLQGRWGLESIAIAVPKGRAAGLAFAQQFAQEARASGLLQSAISRSGMRGTVQVD